MKRPRPMTPLERRFAREFLVDFNGKAAGLRAGYAPEAAANWSRILARSQVRAWLEPRLRARLAGLGHPPEPEDDLLAMASALRIEAPREERLKDREVAFIDAYMLSHHGESAALAAGYSPHCPRATGSKLLARPRVRAEIDRRMDQRSRALGLKADEVMLELAHIAYSNPQDLFDAEGKAIPLEDLPPHVAAGLVVQVREGREGVSTVIRSPPKEKALEELLRRLIPTPGRGAAWRKVGR